MTYRSYLDSFLHPIKVGAGPEVEACNSRAKHLRQSHKRMFTEPGQPGAMFRRAHFTPCCSPRHTEDLLITCVGLDLHLQLLVKPGYRRSRDCFFVDC